jgi:isopentenyl-diphosphate delta-isomerase
MGLHCQLEAFGSLIYKADVRNGLVEHEFDHLLVGHSDLDPTLNIEEAIAWRRVSFVTLEHEVHDRPSAFTPWLRIIIDDGLLQFPNGN